jgi:hypothetical protein
MGSLRCIGSTTYEEYRKHFEKDRALMRRFGKVIVNEPSIEDTKAILRGLKGSYEDHHKVTYTDEAIDAAVDLTAATSLRACFPTRPSTSSTWLALACIQGRRSRASKVIGLAEIEKEVSRVAKIPERNVKEDESAKLFISKPTSRRQCSVRMTPSPLSSMRCSSPARACAKRTSRKAATSSPARPAPARPKLLASLPDARHSAPEVRHVRVHGEALGLQADRCTSGLRRLR